MHPGHELLVVLAADDTPEIITTDLKRLRLVEAAEFVFVKTDPYARFHEMRPGTAAQVVADEYVWRDQEWMSARSRWDWRWFRSAPTSRATVVT